MSRCVQTSSINVREEINPRHVWQLNHGVPSHAAFGTEESAVTFERLPSVQQRKSVDSHVWGDSVRGVGTSSRKGFTSEKASLKTGDGDFPKPSPMFSS